MPSTLRAALRKPRTSVLAVEPGPTLRGRAGSAFVGGLLATLAALTLTACSPENGEVDNDGTDPTTVLPGGNDGNNLQVAPDPTNLVLTGQAQTTQFHATAAHVGDVTAKATWSLSDPSVGTIDKGTLALSGSLDHGGTVRVYANYQDQMGAATLNLRLVAPEVIDPSAPPDAKDWFPGGEGGPQPEVVYPFDNTMMAPNVLQLQVQWKAGTNQTVHRLTVSGPTYERSFYIGSSLCPGGQCTYAIDDKMWSTLAHSSLGLGVTMTVTGVVAKGGQIGTSKPVTIVFSPEDTRGGLYYFSPTIHGIKRVPLGASKPVNFISDGDGTGCAGCHAVSRDGKQVALEYGSGQTAVGSTVVDGTMPSRRNFPLNRSIAWNFAWFNPSGNKLMTNWSGALVVRDPKTGNVLETVNPAFIGGNGKGAMPEWSPDGKWIAFVREFGTMNAYDFELQDSGDIVIMPYNDGSFGPAITVVAAQPGSTVHFWPSWSPDSSWLVFNTMDCASDCEQYSAVATRLRLVRVIDDSGMPIANGKPIELLNGTHLPHNTNNWPKFAPFLQGGHYVFIVYSAMYGWGFNAGTFPQLFMFGLDLDKAKVGSDPSFQPVWLPFQERNTSNHSAIWTTDVACLQDKDCPTDYTCLMNACVPRIG